MKLSDELIEMLKAEVEPLDWGLAAISGKEFTIIILGKRTLSTDQVSILAAHVLLESIISGGFHDANENPNVDVKFRGNKSNVN